MSSLKKRGKKKKKKRKKEEEKGLRKLTFFENGVIE